MSSSPRRPLRALAFTMVGLAAAACSASGAGTPGSSALPSDAEAISLLGDTLRALPISADVRARYERQLADARAAWERHPENADSVIWLARRLGYLGRFRESIDRYTLGLSRHRDDPWMLRHRGHRWISVRRFDRAIEDLERAQRLTSGKPDVVEQDGQPNARNQPIGTLQSNIRYHLGLAYYLRGEWDRALQVYREELAGPVNDDRRVSISHWAYLALCRTGRSAEAADLLRTIGREMNVIENGAYHRLTLLYKGELPRDSLLPAAGVGTGVTDVSTAYGVGTWLLCQGRSTDAERVYRQIIATGQWGAFGYIAAEAELAKRDR
jgi:tetratricopeptide (TPR) repeat protein